MALLKKNPFTPKHLGDISASSKTETFHVLHQHLSLDFFS